MAPGCYGITMVMCLTWWMQLEENHSSHGYTWTHCWRLDYVILRIISGFIQLLSSVLFLSSLCYRTVSSLNIPSCISFSFSFSSLCGGGQEKRWHGRHVPDSLLDNFVFLLSLGHADITYSPTVHSRLCASNLITLSPSALNPALPQNRPFISSTSL